MKKLLLPVLLLLLLLCACASDPNAGTYHGVYVEAEDEVYRMEDFFNGENYLKLEDGGDAELFLNEKTHELTWSLSDGILTLTEAGETYYGQLSDGVVVLDYMGWGMIMTFAADGAVIPETSIQNPVEWEERLADIQAFWNGDWFGYWCISEATGDYASHIGTRYNAAATIELDDDARGTITIWDTAHPRSNPLSESVLRVDDAGGSMGIAMSGQGSFFGGRVNAGDWLIDPTMSEYENTVEISGYYADEEGDFFYTVYLQPWGEEWQGSTLPEGYDWYLQSLADGLVAPPDVLP